MAALLTFISLFARTGGDAAAKGISALSWTLPLPDGDRGTIEVMDPHPLARLASTTVGFPRHSAWEIRDTDSDRNVTLDVFRSSVARQLLVLRRHALHEALSRSTSRSMFGKSRRLPVDTGKLAKMATISTARRC